MNDSGYKLIGMLVWRGTGWYVRRRMPATRVVLAGSLGGLAVLAAAALIARRAGG